MQKLLREKNFDKNNIILPRAFVGKSGLIPGYFLLIKKSKQINPLKISLLSKKIKKEPFAKEEKLPFNGLSKHWQIWF